MLSKEQMLDPTCPFVEWMLFESQVICMYHLGLEASDLPGPSLQILREMQLRKLCYACLTFTGLLNPDDVQYQRAHKPFSALLVVVAGL